eukprot:COSAG04_NODE_10787_length_753_cov_1.180428_2_plen_140_part_01
MRHEPNCDDADDLRRDAAMRHVCHGRIGQGAQRLVSKGGIAPREAHVEVLEHLKRLQLPAHRPNHPCALSDEEKEQFRSYCPPADSLFDEDVVRSVLSGADDGVAGGPSLWRNEHLKVAAETELRLAAITTIMLSMAMGD